MKLTAVAVERMKPNPSRRLEVPDAALQGLYLIVQPSGLKGWALRYRHKGTPRKLTLGRFPALGLAEARDAARDALRRIEAGADPAGEKVEAKRAEPVASTTTVAAVAATYLKRHIDGRGLRSAAEVRRILTKYVLPSWGDREIASIRRGDVAELLDRVQDERGARQADYVLAVVRALMNWHATRSDDFVMPIAKGMRRTEPNSRKRARILDDDEIQLVWHVAETAGTFGDIVRLALLTAQRREKLGAMRWADIDDAGAWHIPTEAREKGTGGALALPQVALDIIRARPIIVGNPYVFAGRGAGHIAGWSPCKRRFDAAVAEANDGKAVAPWVVHDLRRTARSLMSRAGVRPDIAERVLGHVIGGVEGVYDRHAYTVEKADAVARLAALIGRIVEPAGDNVVALPAAVSR